jgi:hypothetical protein
MRITHMIYYSFFFVVYQLLRRTFKLENHEIAIFAGLML